MDKDNENKNKKENTISSRSESVLNVTSTRTPPPVIGEALQECSDKEWDASDEPYSAELLNVKKKPNRVNVFSATEKNTDAVIVTEVVSPPAPPPQPKVLPEYHNLARLIQKFCELLLESTTRDGAEVKIKLEFPDWRNEL